MKLRDSQESADDLENKCSIKNAAEKIEDEDELSTDSEGNDESEYENDTKMDPVDKKAARKEHKKKVKGSEDLPSKFILPSKTLEAAFAVH